MSTDVIERPKSVEELAAEFAEHLPHVLKPSRFACPVERYSAWAKLVAMPRPAAEAVALTNLLRHEVRRALHERANAGPLDPAALAAGLFTVLALRLGEVLPPVYLEGCDEGDLFKGAAAALNRLADDALTAADARAKLAWLLKASLAFRKGVEPHLSGNVREYLAAVEALSAGKLVPSFTFAPNATTRFLIEVSALHRAPSATTTTHPIVCRVLRFFGGDRFRLSRTGQLRLALVAVVATTAIIAGGVYFAARSTIAKFRTENEVATFERSLIPNAR